MSPSCPSPPASSPSPLVDRHALSPPGLAEGRRLRLPRPAARRLARGHGRRARTAAALFAGLGGGGRRHARHGGARGISSRSTGRIAAGDVLLFRWRDGLPAKHCAIATSPDTMVHAHDGARSPRWRSAPGGDATSPTCSRSAFSETSIRFRKADPWPRSFFKPSAPRRRHDRRAARRHGGPRARRTGRRRHRQCAAGRLATPRSSKGRASRTSTGSPPRKARRSRASTAARASAASSSGRRGFEEVANTKIGAIRQRRAARASAAARKTVDAPPIPTSPTSRSACARARSPSCAASGRMDARSTCTTLTMRVHRGQRVAGRRSADRREGRRRRTRPPIAASPMWCSSACRSRISATACRNSPSRWCGPSTASTAMIRAVCLIPGASEFGYDTLAVTQDLGLGATPSGEPPPAAARDRRRRLARRARGALPEPASASRWW